jgi:peptidoglycan/LPS O-acetylase OafA/YrhL
MSEKRPALPALTGLRFIAAMWVVLHHAMRHWRPGIVPVWPIVWNVLYYGYQAVGLFFVLSGFILAYSYTDGAGRLGGTHLAYFVSRVARVYPAYLFAFLLAAGPYFWLNAPTPTTALQVGLHNAVLIQAWTLDNAWNGPGWSLSVEAVFYLLFPALLAPLARIQQRHLLRAALALWLISTASAIVYMGAMHVGWFPYTYFPYILYSNPLLRLPEFCTGMVLGRYYALGGRLRPPLWCAGLAIIGGVTVAAHLPTPLSLTGFLTPAWGILLLAAAPLRRGVLTSAALVALGEASYSLYLLHWPIWDWLTHCLQLPEDQVTTPSPAIFVLIGLYLVALVAASLGTTRLVETPARRAIRAWAKGKAYNDSR